APQTTISGAQIAAGLCGTLTYVLTGVSCFTRVILFLSNPSGGPQNFAFGGSICFACATAAATTTGVPVETTTISQVVLSPRHSRELTSSSSSSTMVHKRRRSTKRHKKRHPRCGFCLEEERKCVCPEVQ